MLVRSLQFLSVTAALVILVPGGVAQNEPQPPPTNNVPPAGAPAQAPVELPPEDPVSAEPQAAPNTSKVPSNNIKPAFTPPPTQALTPPQDGMSEDIPAEPMPPEVEPPPAAETPKSNGRKPPVGGRAANGNKGKNRTESGPVEITVGADKELDEKKAKTPKPNAETAAADLVPEGQELVNIDFPEPTEIKDIIRAVSIWTGKNVIIDKNVSGKVQMISPRKVTKAEAYQAFLSALNVLGFTTVETGKVIKIVPTRNAVRENLRTFLGSSWTPATDELITQIVPLKYVDANEIQRALSKISTLNSMIPYPQTNTLIISDSGYKVRRMLDIVELLDVQTQQPKLAVVPIRYGDAKSIAALVQQIFDSSGARRAAASGSSARSYKIFTDERTNSVVIFGPPRTIADVKALVKKFDSKVDDESRQASIHVRPLDFADATKLAATLSSLASGGKSGTRPRTPPIGSATLAPAPNSPVGSQAPSVATLDNDVKITSDESSNSLLITGSRAAYDSVNSIIRKLDIKRSQVFVEAEILDIAMGGGFKFGTSIFAGSKAGANKVAYTWEAATLAPLIVSQASGATDTQSKADAAGAFKDDLTIGILSGKEVDVPGLGKISPGALIKMIKSDSMSRVLSSPHILTAENEQANITVGKKLFYRTTDVVAGGAASESVKSENANLSLSLKPNVSHSNFITLDIDLNADTGTIDPENRVPSIQTRKSKQIVSVKNGQTVVISGLVEAEEFEVYEKIPLLGDIPILGWLFRNSQIQKKRSNLMIFLTPHVVHGANDLAAIYEKKIEERDEFLEKFYGSNFKEDDFYKMSPQKEDGQFRADAYDVMDERSRRQRDKDLMRDMGYSDEEIQKIQKNLEANAASARNAQDPKAGAVPDTTNNSESEGQDPGLTLPSEGDGDSGGGSEPELPDDMPPPPPDDAIVPSGDEG